MATDKEHLWGTILKILIFCYVTVGGGYELINGIRHHHVEASAIMVLFSCSIFVGRIIYGHYSGAKKTLYAEIYGAIVMAVIFVLHLIYN